MAKEISTKNPIFSNQHISELHALFSLYADPRQRRADVKDILMTAKTLGLDEKYDIVFRLLVEVSESSGDALNFEEFLKVLTARIVTLFYLFRVIHSPRKEKELISVFMIYKEEVNSPLMNSNISTINSNTDSLKNNFTMSLKTSVDTMPRLSHLKDSASSSPKKFKEESLLFDHSISMASFNSHIILFTLNFIN